MDASTSTSSSYSLELNPQQKKEQTENKVYRATDTKLGRDVALKVLPADMAGDPERLGRFRREAKTLAQLTPTNSNPQSTRMRRKRRLLTSSNHLEV